MDPQRKQKFLDHAGHLETMNDACEQARVDYLLTKRGTFATLAGGPLKDFKAAVIAGATTKLMLAKILKAEVMIDPKYKDLIETLVEGQLKEDRAKVRQIISSHLTEDEKRDVRMAADTSDKDFENKMWDAMYNKHGNGGIHEQLAASQLLIDWVWDRQKGAEANMKELLDVYTIAKLFGRSTTSYEDMVAKLVALLPRDQTFTEVKNQLGALLVAWVGGGNRPAGLAWLQMKDSVLNAQNLANIEQVYRDRADDRKEGASSGASSDDEQLTAESVQVTALTKRLEKAEERAERAELRAERAETHSVNVSKWRGARGDEQVCNYFSANGTCKFGSNCKYKHVGGGGGRAGAGDGAKKKGPCYEFRDSGKCWRGDNCRFTH